MIQLTTDQFKDFLVSVGYLKRYSASIRKDNGIEFPTVHLSFGSPEQAQIFLRRILQMSEANRYEATVYVEDTVPEIFSKFGKPKDSPKETVESD